MTSLEMADPISITISSLSLAATIGMFAWQHLRKVDSTICTLVDEQFGRLSGTFSFSLANLGTRPALFKELTVTAFPSPEMYGACCGDSKILTGQPPQIIKAGEMIFVSLESKWTLEFLETAQRETEERGGRDAMLYIQAEAVLWNPKGKRMIASEHVTTTQIPLKNGFVICGIPGEKSFRISTKPSRVQDRK